jgi:hypothetical protein
MGVDATWEDIEGRWFKSQHYTAFVREVRGEYVDVIIVLDSKIAAFLSSGRKIGFYPDAVQKFPYEPSHKEVRLAMCTCFEPQQKRDVLMPSYVLVGLRP